LIAQQAAELAELTDRALRAEAQVKDLQQQQQQQQQQQPAGTCCAALKQQLLTEQEYVSLESAHVKNKCSRSTVTSSALHWHTLMRFGRYVRTLTRAVAVNGSASLVQDNEALSARLEGMHALQLQHDEVSKLDVAHVYIRCSTSSLPSHLQLVLWADDAAAELQQVRHVPLHSSTLHRG
jgi:hypothetical protein